MNRLLMIGSLAALLVGTTGCLHHNVRGGCSTGSCESGGCSDGGCEVGGGCSSGDCGGACGGGGCGALGGSMLGKIGGICGLCGGHGGCRNGCQAGPLGWQQGGLDYSSHLQPGLLGHHAAAALHTRPHSYGPGGQYVGARGFHAGAGGGQYGPGGQSPQVGYPYYTVRGPRDFLMSDPPTIGR